MNGVVHFLIIRYVKVIEWLRDDTNLLVIDHWFTLLRALDFSFENLEHCQWARSFSLLVTLPVYRNLTITHVIVLFRIREIYGKFTSKTSIQELTKQRKNTVRIINELYHTIFDVQDRLWKTQDITPNNDIYSAQIYFSINTTFGNLLLPSIKIIVNSQMLL